MCFARVNKCVLMMFDKCVLIVYDFRILMRGPPNFQFSDKHIEYMGTDTTPSYAEDYKYLKRD